MQTRDPRESSSRPCCHSLAHTNTCTHAPMYTNMFEAHSAHIHIHEHAYMHAYVQILMCILAHSYTQCIDMLILSIHGYMHAHTYTCSYISSLFINTHRHAMLAYMHTHMYTCAHSHTPSAQRRELQQPPQPPLFSQPC